MTIFLFKAKYLYKFYNDNGLFSFLRLLLSSLFVYRKYMIFEKDLTNTIEAMPSKLPIIIRSINNEKYSIDKLAKFWPPFYTNPGMSHLDITKYISSRLSYGELCVIAEHQNEIIHMNWLGFQNTHMFNGYLNEGTLDLDTVLGYNIYTNPEFRHLNVVYAVWVEIFKLLRKDGYNKLIHYVSVQNVASINATSKIFRNIGTLHYLWIFGIKKCYYQMGRN